MQTQTQLPGQVPGCIPLQNKPQTSWSRTWQSDGDMQLRRDVLGRIIQIFQKCKTEFTPEWQQKLPDVVKHVEEALYYDAASKEEYGDSRTLERRLQIVAPRILPSIAQNGQQRAVTSLEEGSRSVASMVNSNPVNGSGMVPTPGLGGNMIPTPGFAGSMMASRAGMMPTPGLSSNKLPASVNSAGNFAANSTASTSNVFSNMMPTPGSSNLLNHQGGNGIRMMQTGQLPVASGFTNGMMPTPGLSIQQQQQQANFMKVGDISVQRHLVRSMNAHLNGNTQLRSPVMNSGMSDTILMNRQQLVNGNIGMPDPNFSNQTSFLLPQQRINQHSRLQTVSVPSVSNDTYAMNAADLAGSGSLYSSLSSGGNGVGLNSQISKMQGQQQQESQQQQQQQQNLQQQQQQQQQSLQQQQQQNLQQQQQQQHSQFQQLQFQSQRIQFQQSDMSMQQQTQEPLEMSRQKQQIVELQNTAIATSVKQVDRPPPAPIKLEHQSSPQLHESAWQQSNGNQVNEQKDRVALADQQDDVKQSHDGKPGDQSGVAPVQLGAQSPVSTTRAQQYVKQQRWLLFLRHASKCSYTGGQCPSSPHCFTAKQLLSHIAQCRDRTRECAYPRCSASIRLLTHHQDCREPRCPVCGPVRQAFMRHPSLSQGEVPGTSPPGASSSNNVREGGTQQPPLKRIKTENNKGSGEDGIGVKMEDQVSSAKSEWRDTPPHVKAEPGALKQEDCDVKPCALTTKVAKPQIIGVSLTELFTPEQIRQHITGLRQWVGQSKTKAEKNQAMEHSLNENACRLCAVEKLSFEPPPIYCTSCGIRIKRNAFYHTTAIRETRHYFCVPCYNEVRTETIEMEGLSYAKATLEKRKHEEEIEEAWVQCDKCNLWQHQVCALFNSRRNEGGEAEYTCPQCCMAEMEMGERLSLPATAVLGAKDLPRTVLSDQLEQRLAAKLKQERLERCKAQGKSYDDVPGAEGLVVRVVSSVDKKLEVKQRFLEIFQEEDYPAEFPYKSKAVLLFQKIEGVEVCLYGMYVQEFGAECTQPNQRRVYLSYLDSVKYFRPDVKTCSGEALRTFVYHELLIGYLDYCKKRGFSSCYIWACPPLKGEDYILYCHPEIQKTPKSDKLREWYLTMLRKASKESIVVEVTNFYDYFFISSGECKAKVTAARLPYFDGDYWPGAAEDMILQLQQEDDDGTKQPKKGKTKKPATKRATKAAAQAEMLMNASKDAQLMQKLGESIMPMKEDFIMVHMHYTCFHCRNFIITGYRWGCRTCKNFQLCNDCYEVESRLDERERHPANIKEKHLLTPVEVNDVPSDTKDIDEIMESEFFDTRHAFLSLCQGNHYQYDTLRRAKHSSMMVLYHLHNPMAPAFVTTCSMCNHDIETGQGWRCETCAEFDLCDGCHLKDEAKKHPHKLTPHPSTSDRNAQNKEARQQRVLQLRKMLDLLVHASQCCAHQCQYPNCCNLKRLFRHGMACPKRIAGGCMLCKKMWYFMQLHARACKESQCRVPRCKDLKEHLRRLQHQMESRRRAAVNEMMRQRAAETAGRS